jgi:hypothetical protein
MIETIKQLTGDFVLMDLGSANSGALFAPFPELARAATVIKVDARDTNQGPSEQFHRVINLKKAVAGTAGTRPFYCRDFPECSSFLKPKDDLVAAYGMEKYFRTDSIVELDCATVPELLAEQGITKVDLFKTDLEGLDFEILQSAENLLKNSLCVQNELRFQPVFQGEPYFHEVVSYLSNIGFELISIRPNVWKYQTPNRNFVRDGRIVWTDALFFLTPEKVRERYAESAWKPFVKQVLLSYAGGLTNFSEFLFIKTKSEYPPAIRQELETFFLQNRSLPLRFVAAIGKTAFGRLFLGAGRRIFAKAYSLCALYGDEVIGMPPSG